MWSWGCDYSFHESYYFGLYAYFLLFHIKKGELSVSLVLYVSLLFTTSWPNAHFSLFSLSSTIPSSQSWRTTMLVINFLIPFMSLSPPPLPPLSVIYSWLPVSPLLSRTPFVCFSLISNLPFLQGTYLHTSIPIHHFIARSLLQHGSWETCQCAHLIFMNSEHCWRSFDPKTWRNYHLK